MATDLHFAKADNFADFYNTFHLNVEIERTFENM